MRQENLELITSAVPNVVESEDEQFEEFDEILISLYTSSVSASTANVKKLQLQGIPKVKKLQGITEIACLFADK